MLSTRKTFEDYYNDTFADLDSAQELEPDADLAHKKCILRRFSISKKEIANSVHPRSDGAELNDENESPNSGTTQNSNQSPPVDKACWRKKAILRGRDPPLSKACRIWTDNLITPVANQVYNYPCPFTVLDSMLEKARELDAERYGSLFEQETGIRERLIALLCKDALRVFEQKVYTLDSLISIGGTPPLDTGVYLHILWSEDKLTMYLYVGQNQETSTRINHHNDPRYHKRHPSLHYYVWNQLGPNAGSAWVMLSKPEVVVGPLLLNCLEMWSALILQTLPMATLLRYLPGKDFSPRAGCHLNVSSPLCQSSQSANLDGKDSGDLYKSNDPLMRDYYTKRQGEYQALRNSDDPILRDYWWDARRRGIESRTLDVRNKSCTSALIGTEVKAHVFPSRSVQQIYLCGYTLNIPVSVVRLHPKEPLSVQCSISDDPDGDCYALSSGPHDDASRLVIRIRGISNKGKAFDRTAHASGQITVCKLNSIFDLLVGRSLEESRQLPRRYLKDQ